MCSQVVAEREPLEPQAASKGDQVKVVRAERWGRFAEPVHHIGAVREIAVFDFTEDRYSGARRLQALDPNHDIDHRFRGKSRHGGAADVLYPAYYPTLDRTIQDCALLFKACGPGFIVGDDMDWLFRDGSHRISGISHRAI